MKQYIDLVNYTLKNGIIRQDRTGTGTLGIFGYQMRFNLEDGFPILTTKKIHFKSVVHELLWFLKGDTNIKYLKENNVKIWNEWADENGELGPIYGAQWRSWKTGSKTIDQISNVIENIKKDPNSRRHIVSAWNVGELEKMALPPCHILFQFYVVNNKLSLLLYQRSADIFLGVPFNISSYSLLLTMIAHVTGYNVGEFIYTIGDAHIYNNHIQQVNLQISRDCLELPEIKLNKDIKNIFDFKYSDIQLDSYQCHSKISGDISI
jgi:thymidylate synthase